MTSSRMSGTVRTRVTADHAWVSSVDRPRSFSQLAACDKRRAADGERRMYRPCLGSCLALMVMVLGIPKGDRSTAFPFVRLYRRSLSSSIMSILRGLPVPDDRTTDGTKDRGSAKAKQARVRREAAIGDKALYANALAKQ